MGKQADEILGICNICGLPVTVGEDVATLMAEAGQLAPALMIYADKRHIKCSPSRNQYFPGQPRDTRPGMHYDPEVEQLYRDAYARLNSK